MMGTGPVPRSTEQGTPHLRRTVDAGHTRSSSEPLRRARNDELAGQLRAAALEGDEAHLRQLLSELLHIRGLTRAQRISLQLTALLNLVQALRSTALTDELTGLYNRHGFMQSGARLLDVAARDV